MNINLPLDGLSAKRTPTTSLPTHDIEALCEAEDIDPTGTRGYKFTAVEQGRIVAELLYAHIPRGNAGYIAWAEVDEAYRRQGIARTLRRAAIGDLIDNGVQRVYSWPTTDAGAGLVDAEGFEPLDNDELPGWRVYE